MNIIQAIAWRQAIPQTSDGSFHIWGTIRQVLMM